MALPARPSLVAASVCAAIAIPGCSGDDATRAQQPAPERKFTVGVIYVGSVTDHGYNQAAHEGVTALGRAFPEARVIAAERVPETGAAERAMKRMIGRGATIVIPTSFGHLESALRVAAQHPEVTVLHMGGLQTSANLGTFFGTIWEAQYAAGQAAGLATRTGRLGYVAAYPIAQSLLGVNAYQLGARSVNARVRTRIAHTGSWCDPVRQRRATRSLLRWGADVIGQHQDCTANVIRTAAAGGAKVTGFHHDARAVAPGAWLTGAVWNWGPLLIDMVETVLAGTFASSRYARRYRGGLREGVVALAPFGRAASTSVRRRVLRTTARLRSGALRPFDGPVRDRSGRVRVAGRQPGPTDLEEMDYLVEGIVGELPGD